MKKSTFIVGWLCLLISVCTIGLVASGQQNYKHAQQYMRVHDIGTDQDIETVLTMYGFDLDFMTEPNGWDYIKSNF